MKFCWDTAKAHAAPKRLRIQMKCCLKVLCGFLLLCAPFLHHTLLSWVIRLFTHCVQQARKYTHSHSTFSFERLVYWLVLALWSLLSAQCLARRTNIPSKSVYSWQSQVTMANWVFLQSYVTSHQMPPLNFNQLYVFINLTLCYHPGGYDLTDESTGLLLDMIKCPPLSYLNPLLDYCLVVKRVFVKGHFS